MNKEDIEKVKKHYIFTTEHELDDDNKTLKEYIEYLEQKELILDKVTDKLKETIKEEREFMKDTEHKSMAFHYSNGREVLTKEILNIIEGDEK